MSMFKVGDLIEVTKSDSLQVNKKFYICEVHNDGRVKVRLKNGQSRTYQPNEIKLIESFDSKYKLSDGEIALNDNVLVTEMYDVYQGQVGKVIDFDDSECYADCDECEDCTCERLKVEFKDGKSKYYEINEINYVTRVHEVNKSSGDIKVGDTVESLTGETGKVKEVRGMDILVDFGFGLLVTMVKSKLKVTTKQNNDSSAKSNVNVNTTKTTFQIGDIVKVTKNGSQQKSKIATVEVINQTGSFVVKFDNGDYRTYKSHELELITEEKEKLSINDDVKTIDGKVGSIEYITDQDTYLVRFNDNHTRYEIYEESALTKIVDEPTYTIKVGGRYIKPDDYKTVVFVSNYTDKCELKMDWINKIVPELVFLAEKTN